MAFLQCFGVMEMTDVTLVTGDGIGPEIAEATRRCIDATGAELNWDVARADPPAG